MDRLRSLFEDLDFTDVSTFIASGNVTFSTDSEDPDALTETIQQHLAQELGYEVATFLRSPAQLAAIAAVSRADDVAAAQSGSSHYVVFLHSPAPESLRSRLADLETEMDSFQFSGPEIHWRIQGKLTDSPLFDGGGLNRAIGTIPTTTRNMNTLRRIVAKTGA